MDEGSFIKLNATIRVGNGVSHPFPARRSKFSKECSTSYWGTIHNFFSFPAAMQETSQNSLTVRGRPRPRMNSHGNLLAGRSKEKDSRLSGNIGGKLKKELPTKYCSESWCAPWTSQASKNMWNMVCVYCLMLSRMRYAPSCGASLRIPFTKQSRVTL